MCDVSWSFGEEALGKHKVQMQLHAGQLQPDLKLECWLSAACMACSYRASPLPNMTT